MVTEVTVLLGGLERILGPGVFTLFDSHKMDERERKECKSFTVEACIDEKEKEQQEEATKAEKTLLHQLRKERHIGSKSHEPSPSPEEEGEINVYRVGFWQQAAPGNQWYDECF
eukprot:1154622-Pelagomonas_calceolata.AAC.2